MALQKQLRGISNFLGLYKQGEVRLDLSPTMQPVFEASKFLQPIEYVQGLSTLGSAGVVATCGDVVPDNEEWICHWMGMKYIGTGVSQVSFKPVISRLGVWYGVQDSADLSFALVTAGNDDVQGAQLNGLTVVSGQQLGFLLVRATGAFGQVDVDAIAQVQKIRI